MAANVQAAVEAQIFGANVTGMVSRTTDGEGKITLEFLVMPSSLTANEEFGIDDVVKEINNTIYRIENNTTDPMPDGHDKYVSADQIQAALSVVGLNDATLTFMQTFIHYKNVDSQGKTEYALGIRIKGQAPSTDFHFLAIKEIYINVWNTQNQKILEKMKIWTTEQLEAAQ